MKEEIMVLWHGFLTGIGLTLGYLAVTYLLKK
jgi:hypothetical protein